MFAHLVQTSFLYYLEKYVLRKTKILTKKNSLNKIFLAPK